MANRKIRMRPEGTNDYGDVLHPETTASQVIQETNLRFITDAERNKLAGIAVGANNYVHPSTAGNKHIPAGGSAGQFLAYGGSSGTAKWEDITTEKYLLSEDGYFTTFEKGYTKGESPSLDVAFNPSYIEFSRQNVQSGTGKGGIQLTAVTSSTIDLSPYNNLMINAVVPKQTHTISTYGDIFLIISPNKLADNTVYTKMSTSLYTSSTTVDKFYTLSIPINDISGNYYIRVHATNSYSSNSMHILLKEMKLSK